MSRILHCLSITGFRRYAIKLLHFLEQEIFGLGGHADYIEKGQRAFMAKKKTGEIPLYNLLVTWPYWKIFQDEPEKGNFHLLQSCVVDDLQEFEESVFFSSST